MKVDTYSALASFYGHLMKSIDYDKWSLYIYNISKEVPKQKLKVLEIASGTGTIANFLVKKFDDLVLTDKSFRMLQQSPLSSNSRVCCDMTKLPFKNKFDFIYSTFDSVNYLLSKEKFISMLKNVSNCLSDEGIYSFDVSMEKNSVRYQRYLNRKGKFQKIVFKQKSFYNEKSRIHYNIFNITLPDGSEIEEVHKQKIYAFEEYFRFIEDSDFYVHNCYEAFTYKNADENSERVQFILKKKHANI